MNYIIQKIRLNSIQYKIQILVDNHLITFEQFTTLLHDPEFIVKFTDSLLLEFDYYFETNAIKNIYTPVIIILSKIIMKGNHNFEAFKEFETHQGNVISFQNLSNDAYLVVPKPIKNNIKNTINYLNLHTFLSSAPETQIIKFWIMVADTAIKYLQINDKIYLKPHGFGVPWIHFRIQKNNKYYFTKESDYNFTQL
jgi:hypothetical protein